MRIPRPDVDRLLWLVGREACATGPSPEASRCTIREGMTSCGYDGDVVVLECLWADVGTLTSADGPEPCAT